MKIKNKTKNPLVSEELLELIAALKSKKVFFFAGSGISLMSGLPSVLDILSRTCQKWIPDLWEHPLKRDLLEKIQPELFYSILLECNYGNTDCLGMWGSFHPKNWEIFADGNYHPKPAIEHLFIAAYSHFAHVPIFTTNYDTMLEQACEDLGIHSKTLIFSDKPPDAVSYTQSQHPLHSGADTVIICKIHGNIYRTQNHFDPDALKTTMAEITKKNEPWLEFLLSILEQKSVCFAGYSGRDIDYFPFIKEYIDNRHSTHAPADYPAAFWMEEKDRETFHNASAINASVIKRYPFAFFADTYEKIFNGTSYAEKIRIALMKNKSDSRAYKEKFLDQIQCEVRGIKGISEERKTWHKFFWMKFSERTGHALDAYKLSHELSVPDVYCNLTQKQKIMVLNTAMMSNRENAYFSTYRKNARELYQLAKREKNKPEIYNAWIQVAASFQMEIPHHLCFQLPVRLQRMHMLLFVRLFYAFLNTYFSLLKICHKDEYRDSLHLIQECQVRTLAIDTALALKLNIRPIKNWVGKRLGNLHDSAYCAGNYITIIGTCKYLNRLSPNGDGHWKHNGEKYADMVSEKSASSILSRGTQESLKNAKENSNTLNAIKAYLQIAYYKYLNGEKQLLPDPYMEHMVACMYKVESKPLRKAFQYIIQNYFCTREPNDLPTDYR